ncbi:hypothetical protein [Persephonella sp.]
MRGLLFILISMVIVSCSSVYNFPKKEISREAPVAVAPFENFTEIPLTGWRASGIVEGVLVSKGFNVVGKVYPKVQNDISESDLTELINEANKKGAKYLITGYVNEWRYKTGIDGEPAVSLTLKIIDIQTGKTVWTGVGSKTGWGHESVGTVAQKVINELVENIGKSK